MAITTLPGLSKLQIGDIFCIGRNYAAHAHELKNNVPTQPLVFLKPKSSVILNGETIFLPSQSMNVHHEVELVVAIGKAGKNIHPKEGLKHVAGYAVGIDVTARDIQQQAKENAHPWTVAKAFDTFAPLSSFVPAEQIQDPQNLELKISVNGEVRQSDSTKSMIFPVSELISYLSGINTLQPGDLIFTGTPKGVSRIESGDTVEAILDQGLARLTVTVN